FLSDSYWYEVLWSERWFVVAATERPRCPGAAPRAGTRSAARLPRRHRPTPRLPACPAGAGPGAGREPLPKPPPPPPLRLALLTLAVAYRSEGPISATSTSTTGGFSPSRVSKDRCL